MALTPPGALAQVKAESFRRLFQSNCEWKRGAVRAASLVERVRSCFLLNRSMTFFSVEAMDSTGSAPERSGRGKHEIKNSAVRCG